MKEQQPEREAKVAYLAPRVLASYTLEELSETLRPHGPQASYDDTGGGGGCGCGCGGGGGCGG